MLLYQSSDHVRISFFFFLMIRRPPRSTPFPTRRSSDLQLVVDWMDRLEPEGRAYLVVKRRSEEHTSELQSRLHLVCRLLLEKKKKMPTKTSAIKNLTTMCRPSLTIINQCHTMSIELYTY